MNQLLPRAAVLCLDLAFLSAVKVPSALDTASDFVLAYVIFCTTKGFSV